MWNPFRSRYLPNGMLRESELIKPPTVGPKGPSPLARPDPPILTPDIAILTIPMCPRHCKACQDEK